MKNVIKKFNAKSLLTTGNILYFLLFSVIFIRIVMSTERLIPGGPVKYAIMIILWGILLLIGYLASKYFMQPKYRKLALFLLFLMQFLYVWAVHSETDSDAYVINYIAFNHACGFTHNLPGWDEYLSIYTNNIPATLVLLAFYHIWLPNTIVESWMFVAIMAALLSDLALFFIYKLVKSLLNEKWAFLSLIMSVFLISLSESATVLYTDIMALWTIPAALYFIVQAFCGKGFLRKLYAVAAGAVLAFGAWVKVQCIIVVIAVCIVMFLALLIERKSGSFRTLLLNGAALLFSLGFVLVILNMVSIKAEGKLGTDFVERNEMPVLHFVAMGLNAENGGGYLESDVEDMKATPGQDAKNALCMEKISERLNTMGASGLFRHIDQKLIEGMGRGTFTTSLVWRGYVLNYHMQARRIQNWTIVTNPQFQNLTAVWIQAGYLIIFLFSIVSAVISIRKKQYQEEPMKFYITSICRISMIGIALMVCILEMNFRYMYSMLPNMILLSLCSLYDLIGFATKKAALVRKKD